MKSSRLLAFAVALGVMAGRAHTPTKSSTTKKTGSTSTQAKKSTSSKSEPAKTETKKSAAKSAAKAETKTPAASGLKAEIKFGTDIKDHEPVGVADSFPA